jgi:hypothetical protein
MNTKYIIAQISLPLKINDDGTYIVMSENVEIKFDNYDGTILPKEACKEEACNELAKMISELFADKNEYVKPKSNRKSTNMTFKNVKGTLNSASNHSVKNRN